MRRLLSPLGLTVSGLGVLLVVAFALWAIPSEHYIFLPDEAHSVAPLVDVKGERPSKDGGGIYFVDVLVRKASVLERLLPELHDGSTIVPASAVTPPGTSERERRTADRVAMERSQEIAAAVALRVLGYKVPTRETGVLVAAVAGDTPAARKLREGDVILAVDGKAVRTPGDLRERIQRHRPGETVRVRFRRDKAVQEASIRTISDPNHPRRTLIGVLAEQAVRIKLPIRVRIDVGNVGGPSAGLAFALDVLEELGRDVDRGYRVAATGEIEIDGGIVPIGGVKQKTIGARRSGMDVLLVPAGENARDARRYAESLRIVPVKNFRQALHALATLPPKA